jgi:hypothetical protein
LSPRRPRSGPRAARGIARPAVGDRAIGVDRSAYRSKRARGPDLHRALTGNPRRAARRTAGCWDGGKDGERSSGRLGPSRSPHPVSSPTPYGRVPLPSSGHHGTPSMPLDPLPPAPMPPPVHAAMARPAQQLDVASALPPKAGVGPMVDRDRRRASTVQDKRPPAPGAALDARHEPPPPPRPPHRRAEIQPIQQRVPPTHAHEPSSGPGRSAQSAPIARKATASSGAARGRRPAEILNHGGRFRSSPNRSDPPHSLVTPEVAGSSPAIAPRLPR